MKILLIGATGQLGCDLLRNNTLHEIHAVGRDELEITNGAQTDAVVRRIRPDMIINCGAFHDLPACEAQPEQAFLVNCIAVRRLAALCAASGAWLVTFSTDYVFDGHAQTPYREDDRPSPLQMYGVSRLAGEHAALATAPEHSVVIRTCGLYGRAGSRSRGGNFVDKRLAEARAGKRIEMASEQTVSPTATQDLSRAVLSLIGHARLAPGIYHLVNEGACSWYELTREIVALAGL
jgi:dTDP-4-dehydrorhamnose reductase